ncbi:MAG: hypothetical protein VKL41_02835 [Snowella sp.]|nr:hypothetical protein [Snowella sp.]
MTANLIHGQQIFDSDDCNRVREELANLVVDLTRLDDNIHTFTAILALESQNQAEIALGVLGRKIIEANHQINEDILWLLLASVLSRSNITIDSPIRISILGLTTCVKDWQSPTFALLTPALDSFLMVSLEQGTPLIAEQTLDFISTWAENYAKAPRTLEKLSLFKFLARSVLQKIDDEELKDEWSEGLVQFEKIASKTSKEKYSNPRIWSFAGCWLKTIYSSQVLVPERKLRLNQEIFALMLILKKSE